MKDVKDLHLDNQKKISDLVKDFESIGGFMAQYIYRATKLLEKMIKDKECVKFISFPACIIATGIRGLIKDALKEKWFDIIITTCGTLDHDIGRTFERYYVGDFRLDDRELRKKNIHRLGSVLVPVKSYGIIIEEKMKEFLEDIYNEGKKELATYELCWEIGKRIDNENSLLYWAYKNKIPVIVPGITDGAVGYQIWLFSQKHPDFKINVLKDESLLNSIVWDAKRTGALIIGGGISKHHTIWWNQFKEGLDYAVYITTAIEYDGSLSGAMPREAISWKKIKENAKYEFVWGDATIILPLIFYTLKDKIKDQ